MFIVSKIIILFNHKNTKFPGSFEKINSFYNKYLSLTHTQTNLYGSNYHKLTLWVKISRISPPRLLEI